MFRDRVVRIIEQHDRTQPLFVYYAMHLLHSPLCVPDAYLERFANVDNEDRRFVAAMTLLMDDVVGDVVAALKRRGLWEDTLFVWSSDNGAAIELDTGAKSAYPLRGGYQTNWEGGVRAPALVSGGALPRSARGRRFEGFVHISDWYATFSRLAGVSAVDEAAEAAGLPPVDSIDVWPLLLGNGSRQAAPRQEFLLTPLEGDVSGRLGHGDAAYMLGEYKLILNNVTQASWCGPVHPNNSVVWNTTATVERCTRPGKRGCLFNVFEDPTEHKDLALALPDKVDELLARLEAAQPGVYDPDRGAREDAAPCGAIRRYAGFLGPWRESPYSPAEPMVV